MEKNGGGGGQVFVLEDWFDLEKTGDVMLSVGEEGKGHPWNK